MSPTESREGLASRETAHCLGVGTFLSVAVLHAIDRYNQIVSKSLTPLGLGFSGVLDQSQLLRQKRWNGESWKRGMSAP